ncbi:MAG: hypothetical protein E6J41_28080 [Chloroflexi bacterium]|nr:MAG: hypothetical protein E6J41_28080 [Chloroflexota bacterium]
MGRDAGGAPAAAGRTPPGPPPRARGPRAALDAGGGEGRRSRGQVREPDRRRAAAPGGGRRGAPGAASPRGAAPDGLGSVRRGAPGRRPRHGRRPPPGGGGPGRPEHCPRAARLPGPPPPRQRLRARSGGHQARPPPRPGRDPAPRRVAAARRRQDRARRAGRRLRVPGLVQRVHQLRRRPARRARPHQPAAARGHDDLGKWLPDATIAIEDSGFWTEPGIDVFAMGRAAWIDWRQKQAVQGASTITQQLVKVRLTGNEVSLDRKVREAVLAIQVEHTYTKRQILEQYLNSIDYGNHARGSLAASRVYFHKDTKDLDLAQASLLAGIPQSPANNDPFTFWDHAKSRQLEVLKAMVRTHKITQEQADEAYAEDLSPPAHMFGPTSQVLGAPAFVDWVEAQIAGKYGTEALTGGGLRVTTTINLQLEAEAQKAVSDQINQYGRLYRESQGAMTAIDPRTGAVLAMVGSANAGTQYNFAWRNPRSPGSSFKIYTYTTAIESGKYTMATMIPDTPVSIVMGQGEPNYQPKNYDGGYHGTLQLQQAMGNSYNVPAVKVEMSLGVDRVADMAKRMGAPPFQPVYAADGSFTWSNNAPSSSFGPSLTLGGYPETPLQMATGASVLGAQGVYHQPYGIGSITASDGTQIFKADPNNGARQVLDPKVAYIMEQIMSNDQNRTRAFGPNSDLTLPGRRVGAKTGTAETFSDGWTVGYTPSLASAFWFGNPDNTLMVYGRDAIQTAAPAWHSFMMNALNTMNAPPGEWFAEPPGLGHASVGGEPVWLLPGTSANQPMPPLPSNVHTSSSAPCPPGQNPNNGNNQNQNNPACQPKPTG